jgi:DNA-binding CsgD family transcriptional regulator
MFERTRHYETAGKKGLTPRQREVLQMVAAGLTNPEIAERLGISLDGAKFHIREILARLEVDSREEAAAWWRANRGLRGRAGGWLRAIAGVGWLKPAALTSAGGVAVVVASVTGFAIFTGGGEPTEAAPLPACELLDLHPEASERSPANGARVFELSLSADGPCLLRGAAWARIFPSLPPPTGPLLVSSPLYEDIYLEVGTATRKIATATWTNWCGPGAAHNIQFDLARDEDRPDGLGPSITATTPVAGAPACEDASQPSKLVVAFEDDDPLPPDCKTEELGLAKAAFAVDARAGTRFTWSVESTRPCYWHDTLTVAVQGGGVQGVLSPPLIDGAPASIEIRQVLGVGLNPVITGTLWNVCGAQGLAMSLAASSAAMVYLDMAAPPCVDANSPGRLTASWAAAKDPKTPQVVPFEALPGDAVYQLYRAQPRDTLLSIAMAHGVSVARLLLSNPGLNADSLTIGQELRIPVADTGPESGGP